MTYAKPKASGLEPRATPARPSGRPAATPRRWSPERLLVACPDFGSRWRVLLLVAAVTAIVGVWLGVVHWDELNVGYGDTDDATRLIAVRELVAGRGWWDELFTRYQAPLGVWMHWSRLLDGGIAALDDLFRLFLSADDAEYMTRFVWPLLWIPPAAWAAITAARRLGLGVVNNAATVIAAIILASDIGLWVQFRPGRIDHHDVQMTFAFLAMTGAMRRTRVVAGAMLAGVACGLGTAIGLEGLVFSAAIGGCIALRFGFSRAAGPAAGAYGLSLALVTAAAFAIQTPPWRWGVEACDALALNLVAAVLVAGLGLAALARWGRGLGWPARLGALVALGAVSGGVYLGLYSHCIHGFFADVDPRIRPIWLNYVQEVTPIRTILKKNLAEGAGHIAVWTLGIVAWLICGLRRERRGDFAWWLNGLLIALGTAAGASALRMTGYAEWFAVPAIAAAAAEVVGWAGYRNWLAVALAAAVACPITASGVAEAATRQVVKLLPTKGRKAAAGPAKKKGPADHCFDDASFDRLAEIGPPGIVLSEIDAGPFIVANTDDSVLAAPYHRMAWGILRAHAILKAPADGASAALARQAGVTYVVQCRLHAHHGDRADMAKSALQRRLDAGQPPSWLQPLTPPSEQLQIYRVLPPGAVAGPPPPDPDARPAAPSKPAPAQPAKPA